MLKATNHKIIVSSDVSQKGRITIGGVVLSGATNFDVSYRERSPTICEVVTGDDVVQNGDILIAHHNTFYLPSPYHIGGDLYSIPSNGKILFAKVLDDGDLLPIYGNMICQKVFVETKIPLPIEQRKYDIHRSVVINSGYTRFNDGQTIFHRPHSNYEMVYNIDGVEKRAIKCHEEMVVGILK